MLTIRWPHLDPSVRSPIGGRILGSRRPLPPSHQTSHERFAGQPSGVFPMLSGILPAAYASGAHISRLPRDLPVSLEFEGGARFAIFARDGVDRRRLDLVGRQLCD